MRLALGLLVSLVLHLSMAKAILRPTPVFIENSTSKFLEVRVEVNPLSSNKKNAPGSESVSLKKLAARVENVNESKNAWEFATPRPVYPSKALEERREGIVLLLIKTDSQGWVIDVVIEKSSGSVDLDHAALAALRSWRVEPSMSVSVPVEFRIRRES